MCGIKKRSATCTRKCGSLVHVFVRVEYLKVLRVLIKVLFWLEGGEVVDQVNKYTVVTPRVPKYQIPTQHFVLI